MVDDKFSLENRSNFHSIPWYNSEGDMIEVSFTNVPFYAEQVNVFLTIYRSQETNGIVGCEIVGVDNILGLNINNMIKAEEKGYRNKKYYEGS